MRKDLIFATCLTTLLGTTGCSWFSDAEEAPPKQAGSSWSLVYRPTIQQGTVLTEEILGALQPGMSKEQVRFLLGSPSLTDIFHEDRWDYVYSMLKPGDKFTRKHLTLDFEDGLLTRISGEYEPGVEGEAANLGETVVDVPDHRDKGIITRTIDTVSGGFGSEPTEIETETGQ